MHRSIVLQRYGGENVGAERTSSAEMVSGRSNTGTKFWRTNIRFCVRLTNGYRAFCDRTPFGTKVEVRTFSVS